LVFLESGADIMSKKTRLAIVVIMVLALAVPLTVSAQSGGPYTAGFQLQNLDPGTATISINYYDQAGGSVATVPDTVSGNGSKTYFPLSAVSSGFNGSVVISSDKPLAAIVNVLKSDFNGGASYGGFSSGATSVNLPLIMKSNFSLHTCSTFRTRVPRPPLPSSATRAAARKASRSRPTRPRLSIRRSTAVCRLATSARPPSPPPSRLR